MESAGYSSSQKKKVFGLERSFFFVIILSVVLSSFLVYLTTRETFFAGFTDHMQQRAVSVAEHTGALLDLRSFTDFDELSKEGSPLYLQAQNVLKNTREIATIRYLYTAGRDSKGKIIYLVDGLDSDEEDFRHPGDLIEPEIQDLLGQCFKGNSVYTSEGILPTSWGDIFLVCYPVRSQGQTVGGLVMEFDVDHVSLTKTNITIQSILLSLTVCVIVVFSSWFVLRKISDSFYRRMAYMDFLTELNNRTTFELDMKHWRENSDDGPIVFVVYDLNNLKKVNDTFGHSVGDSYIRKMANILRSFENDVEVYNYRIGGDEFVSIFIGMPEDKVIGLVSSKFEEYQNSSSSKDYFIFSYGVSSFHPGEDSDLRSVFERADGNMYGFKRHVKGKENGSERS